MQVLPPEKLKNQVLYWKQGGLEDLASAEEIITHTRRYAAGLFFLHLALEKILKALYVEKHGTYAPLTHNLLSLVSKCGLPTDSQQETALAAINEFNLETRYPDDRAAFISRATSAFANESLAKAKDLFQWISQHLHH